jgi:hypothetical protein
MAPGDAIWKRRALPDNSFGRPNTARSDHALFGPSSLLEEQNLL